MSHMYRERKKSINAFVGCLHGCTYCVDSFQRQMKRQKKNCMKCYCYEPHYHPERLLKAPPKTLGDEFIFFPSSGDLAWAPSEVVHAHIAYAIKWHDRTFLIQSKDPLFFHNFEFSPNVILGTTIETDLEVFSFPPDLVTYKDISRAPLPRYRAEYMMKLEHKPKLVTIEPILEFSLLQLLHWMKQIDPDIIYIGYDNHDCKLPEPPLVKTENLITDLHKYTKADIREKTIRKAWWEH